MVSGSDAPFFFFQAEDGIRDADVTGVQTCALPISAPGLGDELEHDLERPGAVGMMHQSVTGDRPRARRPVDREAELVARRRGGDSGAGRRDPRTNAPPTGVPGGAPAPAPVPAPDPSPSAPSTGRSAWITKAMWSSSGTPSSSAPCRTSSRFTPRANALSLSFFFTEDTSRSAKLREGRTSAHATRNPHTSSTPNRVFASGVSRGTPE